jgi:predicted nucleotidyltransferase
MSDIGNHPMSNEIAENIIRIIQACSPVDAIYLYGSRAKQSAHEHSDWDIAVIFTDYETDTLARALRPQSLEAVLERKLKLYQQISVIDLETAPVYLQYSILMSAVKWFDRNVPHVKRVENSILSKWEKDYERYCLRTSVNAASTKNAAHS